MVKFEFKVEIAPTGRAKCKQCKQALAKDDMRLGVKQWVDPEKEMDDRTRSMLESFSWYHPAADCFGGYRKTAAWWAANTPDVLSIQGFDDMSSVDKSKLEELMKSLKDGIAGPKPKAKAKAKAKVKAGATKSRTGSGKSSGDDESADGSSASNDASDAPDSDAESEPKTRKRTSASTKTKNRNSPPKKQKAGSGSDGE